MDELSVAGLVDADELMDLDDAEPSDVDDDEVEHEPDEDQLQELHLHSPLQLNSSSGPASAATSAASSPPAVNDDCGPPIFLSGKPLSIKRGRGRPRREGDILGKPFPRRNTVTGVGGVRMKKWKPGGGNCVRGAPKRVKSFDRSDFNDMMMSADEMILDPETGALVPTERIMIQEELPYAPEAWPGKVCGFCNLGERSQLGQGELLRLTCPDGFTPERIATEQCQPSSVSSTLEYPGDKSPRGPVTCRRQKSFNKCRNPSMTSEYVDELTIIGYTETPDVQLIFEVTGHFYVHRSCTFWSNEVTRTELMGFDNVGPSLLLSMSRKCSFCNHYGASAACRMEGCTRSFHFPCATASGAFQELNSCSLYCSMHLSQVALKCENSVCYTCKTLGDVTNLMYCSVCGEHYHGSCVGLAQHPGVRAGWQCRKCRICQTCRLTGDETKLLTCEQCEKVYHAMCQRPIVASIPKYGWKCRCCRVCGDCGSRTPGAGLSSRWHAHYTVCDSCYQQRNKGFNCPICHRAYRAHAHREMVQCSTCRKFVHGTCDAEADLVAYHQRKEAHPEYEYTCLMCKNIALGGNRMLAKRNSVDEDSMSASQESLYDEPSEFDPPYGPDEGFRSMGLGKGKPFACKIAKKRLGFGPGYPGRPKGVGKLMPGKVGFMKRQRMTEFGRKRGAKYKMRGVFGVPGVGLQRPTADGTKDEEPGIENRLVLCSAKDKYVLTQDICVMCGAIGTDQEGCLISCVQCGQCYHPYCVNVKVTKVILQTGWRCLDCTVCEGCGQRDDENRLVLCDDCDISFHIYCMDPPLNYVPHGNWKCKWCALCQTCGAADPGFNCNWMNSYTECGPCASHTACPSCQESYGEGELIIQCNQCERWLHGACDSIKSELDAEKCAEEGYTCILCRPRDEKPPHLVPVSVTKPPTPTKSPEAKAHSNYFLDGVVLSESGHNMIKSLCSEHSATRKKRKKPEKQLVQHNKEAGIMATIESVIAGVGAGENSLDAKLELVDIKDEHDLYKEGMTWTKDDGPPPEGFTLFTGESGITVLRRKRQRNLQKLGIGGFVVRVRGIRGQDNDEVDMLPGQTTPTDPLGPPTLMDNQQPGEKPRRKPIRRKIKSKLSETFPVYLQDAFFGRDLLDSQKELGSESSEDEKEKSTLEKDKIIHLSQEELRAVTTAKEKNAPYCKSSNLKTKLVAPPQGVLGVVAQPSIIPKEEDESDDALNQFELPDILDTDIVDTIINGGDALTKGDDGDGSKDTKDEFSDIFNIDIPNINSKDVEDILFKGVLTDESQESQESSNLFPIATPTVFPVVGGATPGPGMGVTPQSAIPANVRSTSIPGNNLNSPMSSYPQSPYQSDFSNSPQFSPYCEPPSPWVNVNNESAGAGGEIDTTVNVPTTYNQRSSEKMKADEALGLSATISAVLYANTNHPEWKTEFAVWSDRYKQIIKKWRTLSNEAKAPFLQRAKDNRSAQRMKKAQQISKESSGSASGAAAKAQPAAAAGVAPVASPVHAAQQPPTVSEVCTAHSQQQPARQLLTTTAITSVPSVGSGASGASTPTPSPSPLSITPPSRPGSVPPPAPTPPAAVLTHPPPLHLQPHPSTQQQFTVHGPILGPGDPCHGPAPNVTVNPLYSEPAPSPQIRHAHAQPSPSAADHQIRVLTPSEIMRTLPSLCQEACEPPEQEKISNQQKSAREAEQERQWKHLQAMRQQQNQQQQHVLQEHRVQGTNSIVRVQRQLSEGNQHFIQPDGMNQQQADVIHSEGFAQQTPPQIVRSLSADPYAQQPSTPRPNVVARPTQICFPQSKAEPEANRQLRDLLQRQQQFKKLDDQLLAGKGQQRVWPPNSSEAGQEMPDSQPVTATSEATFRQPLPPTFVRQRVPVQAIRQPNNLRLQLDPRLQGMDSRMRHILQQQQQRTQVGQVAQVPQVSQGTVPVQQQFQQTPHVQQQPRFVTPQQLQPIRHASAEIDQLLIQRATAANQFPQNQIRPNQIPTTLQQKIIPQTSTTQGPVQGIPPQAPPVGVEQPGEHEIPDNVTAELEKLEQESSSMVELQGVGDILGGLGDDEDELLAEMGPDFNILEYADPELDALDGEKTNILDSLDLVDAAEPEKVDKKDKMPLAKTAGPPGQPQLQQPQQQTPQQIQTQQQEAVRSIENQLQAQAPSLAVQQIQVPQQVQQVPQVQQQPQVQNVAMAGHMQKMQPPPLVATQQTQQMLQQHGAMQPQHMIPPQINHQLIHQQMLQQVQQSAARGKPMPQGSRIMSQDGVIGTIAANNSIILSYNPNHQQRMMQLQNQKLQMRNLNNSRMAAPQGVIQGQGQRTVGVAQQQQVAAPPPPPPYPGPPPPYPGNGQQMGGPPLRHGPQHGLVRPFAHASRRPALLLEEQPLLIQELLEQEKREQEKQMQSQGAGMSTGEVTSTSGLPGTALLSDNDFENLLKNDFESNTDPMLGSTPVSGSGMIPRPNFVPQSSQSSAPQQWQPQSQQPQQARMQVVAPPVPSQSEIPRVPQFQGVFHSAPPLPPENIISETDKQSQLVYENWLQGHNNTLAQQLKYYDTEVQALRKVRKSLNSKQRQCKKTGGQLSDADALELQRTSAQITTVQKQLESARKQTKQHTLLMQDYSNKKQSKQGGQPSPLAPPSSSPIHPPQSPMMSPSASQSPMMQHNSPMHSPAPSVSHSPGPSVLQSPNMSQVMSPMQPSRIGTPHSQNEGSPGPVQSPLMHLPHPQMRMTSPQHRRVVTSPIGYPDMRPGGPQRFARPQLDRVRMPAGQSSPSIYQSKPGTPSPLNSPPPQQMNQQLLQRHLQQQAFFQHQQQQQQQQSQDGNQEGVNSPKIVQLIHQRQMVRGQMQPQGQPMQQQHQMMLQQQQQLKQQQQAQIQQRLQQQQMQMQQQQMQQQMQQIQQNQPPNSPMPPQSPLLNQQIMSPHSMTSQPPSPMPPRSPMVQFNHPPNSPMPKSPAIHNQPPNSPMIHQPPSPMVQQRRPPSTSNSPATDNPRTPYNALTDPNIPDNDLGGGGNSHAPIPLPPPSFGRFGHIKLGLRGGAPMWGSSYARGAKKIPSAPAGGETQDEKPTSSVGGELNCALPKFKKESHLSKVSILKKKSPAKLPLSLTKVSASSLVSQEYNEFEDSSSSPQMPHSPSIPSIASTSRVIRAGGKKLPEDDDILMMVADKNLPNDIMEYDDIDIDIDSTVVSTEVSLNSAAQQNDGDDIAVIHSFTQDITEGLSSPLEADPPDEYMLFDIGGNPQYSDKEEDAETMQYVLQSPTTSDDEELILQGPADPNLNMLVHEDLNDGEHDAEGESESGHEGDNDDITIDAAGEESPEEVSFEIDKVQVATKEDFEEMIDEGANKKSGMSEVLKVDPQQISEIHKYAANMVYKTSGNIIKTVTNVRPNLVSIKGTPKMTLITSPLVTGQISTTAKKDIIITTQGYKTPASMAAVLLKSNSVRNNIINVPKLGTSASPAITIVSASTSQIASILPSHFTVPVISASAISKLPNVKVIDKPSSSLSLATPQDTSLPKKIFEDDSVSPDSSNTEDEKKDDSPGAPATDPPISSIKDNAIVSTNIKQEPMDVNEKTDVPDISRELKMTTQVVSGGKTAPVKPEIQYMMQDGGDNHTEEHDHKSVVISIPSPTPSQEQLLDNIALQAFENRRRDGNGMAGEFDSFDDVLNMIENIGKAVEEENDAGLSEQIIKTEIKREVDVAGIAISSAALITAISSSTIETSSVATAAPANKQEFSTALPQTLKSLSETKTVATVNVIPQVVAPVTVSTSAVLRPNSTMAQLSPLSQPTEVTNNIANVSEQLRTLLTNAMHTSTSTKAINADAISKIGSISQNEKIVLTSIKSETIASTPITSSILANAMITKSIAPPRRVSSPAVSASQVIQSQTIVSSLVLPTVTTKVVHAPASPLLSNLLPSKTMEQSLMTVVSSSSPDPKLMHKLVSLSSTTTAPNLSGTQTPVLTQSQTEQTQQTASTTIAQQQIVQVVQPLKKPSLSLNAMLQSHPAATMPQSSPSTITTASILGSSIPLTRPSLTSLAQAKPHVVSPISTVASSAATTSNSNNSSTQSLPPTTTPALLTSNPATSAFARTTTNLLHTQLTKTTVSRPKPEDEREKNDKAMEEQSITAASLLKQEVKPTVQSVMASANTLPMSTLSSLMASTSNRMEDSQNVLLKQLLQNTACASTQSTTPVSTVTVTSNSGPSLPLVPNLAAQLARPVPPTPTSLLPPILQNDTASATTPATTVSTATVNVVSQPVKVKTPIMNRETSFVSKPVVQTPQPQAQQQMMLQQSQLQQQQQIPIHQPVQMQQAPPLQPIIQTQQQLQQPPIAQQHQQQLLHIDIKKGLPPSRTPSRDDLLSPATPRSTCSQDSSLQTPPLVVKKELTSQSPVLPTQEVKKELLDESSQHSEVSDHSKSDVTMKEEIDESVEKQMDKEELKKHKRRVYQQKRRQNQILNKEGGQTGGQPKKRSRKSSKVDEDYDSYIESVLAQLRALPPMVVSEPILSKNFAVVSVYGSGDQSKLGTKEFDPRVGDLIGAYGNACVPGFADFYNSKPYGDLDQLPEKPPTSTQRGFYDQEFPLIRFDTDGDKKWEIFARDDTPDTIICSSSPELVDEPKRFLGLRLIEQEESDGSDQADKDRLSPIIPIIAPVPIRLKPTSLNLKDYPNLDKENICNLPGSAKSKFGTPGSGTPLKDSGNVTVTLTLTSSAAEDIMGVLRDLANILHIPAPTSYQIVERTGTPPSQKLGLYRIKGKDGKEGAPIDIQSILNGDAKFCRHCDVVILENMIRKKVSELPFLNKDLELLSDGDEIYFCSSRCYMQLALMHRSPSISEDKAAALIKHLCQKEDTKKLDHKEPIKITEMEKMDVDQIATQVKTEKPIAIKTEEDDAMQVDDIDAHVQVVQKWKNLKYKPFNSNCIQLANKYKKPTDKEIMELMYRLRVTVMPTKVPDDTRKCMFCNGTSDAVADGPARLLNFDVDKWVHLNCGLWSDGVYETVNGALMNLPAALQSSLVSTCIQCNQLGATIRCFKPRCSNIYHLPCAVKDNCVFYKNKSTFCSAHVPKNEKDNELTTLSVSRRVYVDRDENRQVAAVMHHSDQNNLLRVGSLIFLSVGQLLPHQLANFHTANYIYPIGYKIIRFYWSMRKLNKRCRYICSIHELSGRPEFRILVQEPCEDDQEFRDSSCKRVWLKVLEPLAQLRRENHCVQLFTQFVSGEDLFGLSEPAVVRVLESLPGIETLTDYKFKYGRNPLLELPLAINPSGAARTEPRLRNQLHWKRPHTQRTGNSARPVFAPATVTQPAGEAACPYSKQFVHSKSSQYKKMKQEWRNNVFLARSKIQGLGLYAARDLEKHTMVIEYIGEIIRSELSETREKFYDAKNRGIYMFRLDEERVVDATLCGGLARYINHSCNPNCVAEIVEVDRDLRIIIFAKRRIQRGEELAYDYKFDIEDDQHKISCMCGAPNCKKWMN